MQSDTTCRQMSRREHLVNTWNSENAQQFIEGFQSLEPEHRQLLIDRLNETFPPDEYQDQVERKNRALHNSSAARDILRGARQHYPNVTEWSSAKGDPEDLRGCAVVLTAGGEGERLRLSLLKSGVDSRDLSDFTKATHPLPDFPGSFGTLDINLALLKHLGRESGIELPVVVTTGPEGSTTSRVIPDKLRLRKNFGLDSLFVVFQDARLHLTENDRIAFTLKEGVPIPVTNPDETGGPVMKLKQPGNNGEAGILDHLKRLNCSRILLLQATAVYDPDLILKMASAAIGHDVLGVGVERTEFASDDPFGTMVMVEKEGKRRLHILEQDIRNEETRHLTAPNGRFAPANTGFYVFDLSLLEKEDLPDYATPPKEITPDLPRAPKIGFAATDLVPKAQNPAILTIPQDTYGVLKKAGDLRYVTDLAQRLGLEKISREILTE